ncbi:FixH family protein [Paenibacillus beijingensis]|uniref:YtkA-like domain-containing protein n=1 Tax=Paenibacillus beijingensis TaxID=1126833 RepID=A0A0D5NKL9_9BACL|nr:FixH family protein [Paenibacillus beijingensis]AJY75557.1 hypothetical protein VN24_14530 [Paenibacillus beijingensis]
MKNGGKLTVVLICMLLLSACSPPSPNAASKYQKENVLGIVIIVPDPITLGKPQRFIAVLEQAGTKVDNADDVRFTIWGSGDTGPRETVAAANDGNGIYSVEKMIDREGVYYVQVNASAGGSSVMPTKRFIAGDVTQEDGAPDNLHQAPTGHEHH